MAIVFSIWGARAGASPWSPTRAALSVHSAMHSGESADRQPAVIIRVPLLMVPFSGLYSYASAASRQRVLKNEFPFFSSPVLKYVLAAVRPSISLLALLRSQTQ